MEATPRVTLPTGSTAGDTACAEAGVETADIIAANKRKFRRCKFMLPSVSSSSVLTSGPGRPDSKEKAGHIYSASREMQKISAWKVHVVRPVATYGTQSQRLLKWATTAAFGRCC
jgi:hypothetical protein